MILSVSTRIALSTDIIENVEVLKYSKKTDKNSTHFANVYGFQRMIYGSHVPGICINSIATLSKLALSGNIVKARTDDA